MAVQLTKFFVANILDGCRPWDLASTLKDFGDIAESSIVRKRNKEGLKFGFVSFRGVKDWKELEKSMRGLKLGKHTLKINLAKFAKENGSVETGRFVAGSGPTDKRKEVDTNFKRNDAFTRQGCSFSNVLMKDMEDVKRKEDEVEPKEKVINVHKETSAFFDLQGRAVVGRAKDFGCLVSMKGNLSKAGIYGYKLYFLGGMNMMLAFEDEIDATDFILNVVKWKEWFESLDIWSGQTMSYERLEWIKFHGMPLHLAENKVFDGVASLFGKVVKGVSDVAERLGSVYQQCWCLGRSRL
ncbi:putative RNA recognition motif domain, nucleotide-binding alpha-beta plait domain superfamily [Helianthus annuus]|nr:putative RNA recognition motif domain, nucleotide-binding alpha-beta plait domain superfamily [Helianthus annuus]